MKKRIKHMGTIFVDWFAVNSMIFFTWGFISWVEVICKNLDPNPNYSSWNLIKLIVETICA